MFGKGAQKTALGVQFKNLAEQIGIQRRHPFQISGREHDLQHVERLFPSETGISRRIVIRQQVGFSGQPHYKNALILP
jgi:hypothetical protein